MGEAGLGSGAGRRGSEEAGGEGRGRLWERPGGGSGGGSGERLSVGEALGEARRVWGGSGGRLLEGRLSS